MTVAAPDFPDILQHFVLAGHFDGAEPLGSGHINDTWLIRINHFDSRKRYVLQRINKTVFREPLTVMENIDRVTRHIQGLPQARFSGQLQGQASFAPIRTHGGDPCSQDDAGQTWRLWPYVYGASSINNAQSTEQAREAAKAFGIFQCLLQDLPGPPLKETIPGFHDTVDRLEKFRAALDVDRHDRARTCTAETDAALSYEPFVTSFCSLADSGALPSRIAHNDTKINNVMLSDATGEAVCVIDLDTVMTGLALYDFGDMVRTMTISAREDEADCGEVVMRMDYYEAVTAGYLGAAGAFLSQDEIQNLPDAAKIITFENGLRFLTDHLDGDRYFRTSRENQNLDRCRTQFALVRSIDEQLDAMRSITTKLAS